MKWFKSMESINKKTILVFIKINPKPHGLHLSEKDFISVLGLIVTDWCILKPNYYLFFTIHKPYNLFRSLAQIIV